MPSKKVFLKRNRPFVHEQLKSAEAQEYLGSSKRSVGSYFATKHSQRQGTGLTDEEVKLLLPQIIDIQPEDREFRTKVRNFFQDISTPVPYERGTELEIGLELDNDKPVTHFIEKEIEPAMGDKPAKTKKIYNMPIDPEQYIRYRHALGHPHVASTPELAKGNQTVDYFIEDPEKVLSSNVNSADYADKAFSLFMQLKSEPDKVKMILSLLRMEIPRKVVGQPIIVDKLSEEERVLALRKLAMSKPAMFLKIAEDKELRFKYLLDELISVQLLKRAGSSILVTQSGEPLGSNDSEAIKNLFEDPAKAPLLSLLKGTYKDLKEKLALTT